MRGRREIRVLELEIMGWPHWVHSVEKLGGSRRNWLMSDYGEGLTTQAAIGYLRVSTREKDRSGLGLAAQRHEIEAFSKREGFAVRSWYQDVQTGAGADALHLRPGLASALKDASWHGAR